MGIKTTIDTRGVVCENIDGESVFNVAIKRSNHGANAITFTNTDPTLSTVKYVFCDVTASTGMTASLPAISSTNVGTNYVVMKFSGSNAVKVTGSNNVNNDSHFVLSSSYGVLDLMAVSGANGYYWHVLDHK